MSGCRARSVDLSGGLHRLLLAAVLGLLSIAGWKHAYYEMFRQFSPWDDEGTMMSLVKSFLDGGVLFDEVRSPGYGPFYYLLKAVLYGVFDTPVTHDANRLMSVGFWIVSALVCALVVHRITRSIAASAVAFLLLVPHLRFFTNEPGHPQELGVLLVVCALLAATLVQSERSRSAAACAIGGLTAALFLTKVNVGFFLVLAAGLAGMAFFQNGRRPRFPAALVGAGAVALPFILMVADLGSEWGLSYALVVSSAIAAALFVSFAAEPRAPGGGRELLLACAGFAAVALASCMVVLARGSSLEGLLDGIVLERLALYTKGSGFFVIPAVVGYEAIAAAAASLFVARWWAARIASGRRDPGALKAIAVLKLAWAALVAYWVLYDDPYASNALLAYATPFAWLVLVRCDRGEPLAGDSEFSRGFLCFAVVIHALVAYPVHGSQALLATFLLIPVAAVCVFDALQELAGEALNRMPGRRPSGLRLAGLVVGIVAVSGYTWAYDLPRLRAVYESQVPLGLPGSERIRLPARQVETYRWLVSKLRGHCDGFFGIPMYPSLYFWTGYEPPTTAFDAWIVVFDESWEQQAVEKIRRYERPCIIYNEQGQRFWTRRMRDGHRRNGPIARYARESYVAVAERAGFELLIEKVRVEASAP